MIDQYRGSVLRWLSEYQPESDLERIYMKRHADTGRWFVESRQLKDWHEADQHQLLWCYGSGMIWYPLPRAGTDIV